MDREEYAKWIEYAVSNNTNLSIEKFEDYDNWRSKLRFAMLLSVQYQEHVPALGLLESILKEDLIAFNEQEGITYRQFIEGKIQTLEWIGSLSSSINNDVLKAYHYTDKALEIAEFVDYDFNAILRGDIWASKLGYLREIKGDQVVLDEIEDRINYHQDHYSPGSNSYMYYGYRLLALMEWEKGNKEQECNYYKKALDYFPLGDDEKAKLEKIWACRHDDFGNASNQMELLTAVYRDWDL